jgi:hypothetical protein
LTDKFVAIGVVSGVVIDFDLKALNVHHHLARF